MTVLPLPLFAAGVAPSRGIEDRQFILEITGVCLGMSVDDPAFWLAVVQIIWVDLLLSGDNAVWIAGETITKDPFVTAYLDLSSAHSAHLVGAAFGAILVRGMGLLRRRWLRRNAPDKV